MRWGDFVKTVVASTVTIQKEGERKASSHRHGCAGKPKPCRGLYEEKIWWSLPAICIDILTVNFHYNVKNKQTNKKTQELKTWLGDTTCISIWTIAVFQGGNSEGNLTLAKQLHDPVNSFLYFKTIFSLWDEMWDFLTIPFMLNLW